MLIRSKIIRAGGTKVTLDGVEYHFKPEAEDDPAHVCDVTNGAHQAQLLSIKDGFAIHVQKTDEQKAEAKQAEEAVKAAEKAAEDDGLESMTRADLDKAFRELFERAPNSRATDAAVIAKIREKRIEQASQAPANEQNEKPAPTEKKATAKAAKK